MGKAEWVMGKVSLYGWNIKADSGLGGSMIRLRFSILSLLFATLVALSAPFSAQADEKKKKGQAAQPTVIVAPTPAPTPARPANGSLFTDDGLGLNLFGDFKPRRVGDLVFVDVIEASAASVSSGAKRARESGTLGGLGTIAGALPVPGAEAAAGVIGALGARKYEGSGSTQRESSLNARITARVVEVLPNGDLRIEAQKLVKINKEDEHLVLSGIVRQRDVSADNAVPTTAVGDLRVELNGKGVASADNAPGWLFRLFEKITPF
jgi:flagellar L-ring protein precursor FlgH